MSLSTDVETKKGLWGHVSQLLFSTTNRRDMSFLKNVWQIYKEVKPSIQTLPVYSYK